MDVYLQSNFEREHSSVGLEHLPYKQRVGGSNPSAPTESHSIRVVFLWFKLFLKRSVGVFRHYKFLN